jgi:regulator of nucleoside diphosphate kinase
MDGAGAPDARFVRLGSLLTYMDLRTRRRRMIRVVAPERANADEGEVSVLSPIGAALIGLREGAVIRWRTADGGMRAVKVLTIET